MAEPKKETQCDVCLVSLAWCDTYLVGDMKMCENCHRADLDIDLARERLEASDAD